MKKIFMNKTLSLLTLFTCFFVVQNLEAKVAASRNQHTPDRNLYSDLDSEYIDTMDPELRSASRPELDLFAGMGEFSANQASVFSIDELKTDIRDLKINIDDTKGEVTLFGTIPVVCSQHLAVEAVRPSALTDVRVGFRISDLTGAGRACLVKSRGKTCDALGGCVSFEELMEDDSSRIQAKFRLPDYKTRRFVVSVQTRVLDKSRSVLSWADYGQVNTIRFKSRSSDDERNSSTSRLASARAHSEKSEFQNEYAHTYIGKRKSSRPCSENVVDQFVIAQPMMSQPMMPQPFMQAPMMMPQPQMIPQQRFFQPMMPPMMAQRPPFFAPPMMQAPMMHPQMIRPFPQVLPRPPMVMPPFMNGGCPTGCVGGFRPGVIPPNFNQTLPAIRYPQMNFPRNNLQLSLNANFGV
jgi:hypothetical protein